jgi:hypothetical protein
MEKIMGNSWDRVPNQVTERLRSRIGAVVVFQKIICPEGGACLRILDWATREILFQGNIQDEGEDWFTVTPGCDGGRKWQGGANA